MDFDPNNFRTVSYGTINLYFDKNYIFHDYFHHKQKTKKFPYYRNILGFLSENPSAKIYFTLSDLVPSFQRDGDCFIINMNAYQQFCSTIGTKTSGRFKAFIGQNINLRDVNVSDAEKASYIKANATETDIIEIIQTLNPSVQTKIFNSLKAVNQTPTSQDTPNITQAEFISALSRFITDADLQKAFYSQLPKVQIDILKSHITFLKENLDKNETFIQKWIDEGDGKFRKQRCLIFGLEYVDPVREGQVASKQFDILAEQDLEHYVIFELKAPQDDIFKVIEKQMSAGGTSVEYHLSPQLSRAIPEVLGYRKMYEDAQSEELKKMGIKTHKPVSKCVIVLGTRKNDQVWKENFNRVRNSLTNIELLTYDHLIDRLENTVKNLEEHTATIN